MRPRPCTPPRDSPIVLRRPRIASKVLNISPLDINCTRDGQSQAPASVRRHYRKLTSPPSSYNKTTARPSVVSLAAGALLLGSLELLDLGLEFLPPFVLAQVGVLCDASLLPLALEELGEGVAG